MPPIAGKHLRVLALCSEITTDVSSGKSMWNGTDDEQKYRMAHVNEQIEDLADLGAIESTPTVSGVHGWKITELGARALAEAEK